MSGPRTPDGPDGPDEGSGWREPEHLGEPGNDDGAQQPGGAGRSDSWQPPGWDLPPADRPIPARSGEPSGPPAHGVPVEYQETEQPGPIRSGAGGLFGPPRPRTPNEFAQTFAYRGDTVGAQAWAVQHGWVVSDGTGPEDADLAELVASAPTRLTRDHRAAGVLRGRYGSLDLVAFDVVYADRQRLVPQYAITAAPVLAAVPGLRLAPARFWKHRTGGLLQFSSGDAEFDGRWVLLAAEDAPSVRRLAEDPTVRGLLLGGDDGDEFWTATSTGAAGHGTPYVAAIRPDGHRPELIEHHARLLAAIVAALAAAG